MMQPIATVRVRDEQDVVLARQRARQIAALLGFDSQDQARIATAISELARNAFEYAHGATVQYILSRELNGSLVISITDRGPGIDNLQAVLDGSYESRTGMGLGIPGARRLMDRFTIESTQDGTTVIVAKQLDVPVPSEAAVARIAQKLTRETIGGPIGELQQQNQELLRALAELETRQQDLARLNRELEETNRGVVALYAELDERAEALRRSSESKSRFLSSVSHELRTPLSSTLALTDLLLAHADGPLTDEQERQVTYIRSSAETLLTLVNELLDLARIEAGKVSVEPTWYAVEDLLSALRGVIRPLHHNESVALVFEPPETDAWIYGDESKAAQILRNLVSNALKFTEKGEVRVQAEPDARAGQMVFRVADTGIGINPQDQARIFDDFEQVAGPLQEPTRGTGLGLAVSKRLSHVLAGDLTVQSRPGHGSVFTLSVPLVYADAAGEPGARSAPDEENDDLPTTTDAIKRKTALVIDDDHIERYVAAHTLRRLGLQVAEARDGISGLCAARDGQPDVIVLDLRMPGIDGFGVLEKLSQEAATAAIPVVIHTAKPITPAERTRLSAAAAVLAKQEGDRGQLEATVSGLLKATAAR